MALQVAVFGLGTFGFTLAVEIEKKGYSVLAVDIDPQKIKSIEGQVSRAVVLRSMSEEDIKNTLVAQCEVAVISFVGNLDDNIFLTQLLKELGVPFIITRSESAVHARVLQKIGADDIFFPEEDMAVRIANRITGTGFLDFIEISDQYAISEFQTPSFMSGKTIANLDLRKEKGIQILAIRRKGEVIIPPDPDKPLEDEDLIIALGPRKTIQEFSKAK